MPDTSPPTTPPKRAKKQRKRARAKPGTPGGAKNGVKFVPDEKQRGSVQSLTAAGYPRDRIAAYIGISVPTLEKHFSRELEFATMELIGAAVGGLADGLKKKEAWAICFVLKTRGRFLHNGEGWREYDPPAAKETDETGSLLPTHISSLTDAQLIKLLDRLQIAAETADARANSQPHLIGSNSTGR